MKILKRFNYTHVSLGLSLLITLIFITGCQNLNGQVKKEDGFKSMFDGKTLTNWEGNNDYWRVEKGHLVGEETAVTSPLLKANTFLIWKGGQPGNFELKAEYRISENGNSGINYRSDELQEIPFALKGYQLDIDGKNNYTGQNYEERKRTTLAYRGQKVTIPEMTGTMASHLEGNAWKSAVVNGTLGNSEFLKSKIKPREWNQVHIIANGNKLQHFVNGILMSEVTDNDSINSKSAGLIGLQLHAGMIMKVEYRNLRIKNL
jgi:hypothetical protein